MPVTKTAKRALRGSKNKEVVNKLILAKLEVAVRKAKNSKTVESIVKAISLSDRAAKNKVIHKNKAARIKSQLNKLVSSKAQPKTATKKASKK